MVTILEALEDSAVLHADNPAHVDLVTRVISYSAARTDRVIVDGNYTPSPAAHSAAAKVILNTLDVDFVGITGNHTIWKRSA